jgi:hypothetical protein
MTTDDFVDSLRADWLRQGVDLDRITRLVVQRQVRAKRVARMNMACAGAVLLFGAWFAYRALVMRDALYALGGAALLVALPLILAEYLSSRRNAIVRIDDTPSGILLQARHQAETSRRLLRGCRAAATILLVCTVSVLGLFVLGLAPRGIAASLALLWGAAALAAWLWQSVRGRRLAAEIMRYDQFLAEFIDADR